MYLYMKVTKDKYELPIAVADTPRELSKMVGIKAQSISRYICLGLEGYKKVYIGERDALDTDY